MSLQLDPGATLLAYLQRPGTTLLERFVFRGSAPPAAALAVTDLARMALVASEAGTGGRAQLRVELEPLQLSPSPSVAAPSPSRFPSASGAGAAVTSQLRPPARAAFEVTLRITGAPLLYYAFQSVTCPLRLASGAALGLTDRSAALTAVAAVRVSASAPEAPSLTLPSLTLGHADSGEAACVPGVASDAGALPSSAAASSDVRLTLAVDVEAEALTKALASRRLQSGAAPPAATLVSLLQQAAQAALQAALGGSAFAQPLAAAAAAMQAEAAQDASLPPLSSQPQVLDVTLSVPQSTTGGGGSSEVAQSSTAAAVGASVGCLLVAAAAAYLFARRRRLRRCQPAAAALEPQPSSAKPCPLPTAPDCEDPVSEDGPEYWARPSCPPAPVDDPTV